MKQIGTAQNQKTKAARLIHNDSTARAENKTMKFKSSIILPIWTAAAVIAGAQLSAPPAHGQAVTNDATGTISTNAVDPALLKRLDDLEQQVKILERNREVDQETSTDKAKEVPIVSLGDNGLTIRSTDSNFVSYIHGYAQVNGRFYTGDNNAANDTFLPRPADHRGHGLPVF
jgi:hypothetical protein